MSEYRKTTPNDLYFVTLTIEGWVDLFTRKECKDIIIENLKYCQEKEQLEIYAYVLMSNHLHMICRRMDKDLKELLGRFESFTAKKLLAFIEQDARESRKDWLLFLFQTFAKKNEQYSKHHVWQYTNQPTPLYSLEVIMQKRDYIHQNPVRAGIVKQDFEYIYSSACVESPLKVLEL